MPGRRGDYRILMLPEGRRHLARLPEKVAHAALGFIHGPIAGDPHRVGKPLGDDLDGLCSARRADYRIVYRIDDEARTVTIYRIQHRSDVYRPR